MSRKRYFHLHLVSDATGETLLNVAHAAAAQYTATHAIEHVHSLIRTKAQLDQTAREIEAAPGIVLYTLVDPDLAEHFDMKCRELNVPAVSVLDPVLTAFQAYLGTRSAGRVGAQHVLDADYFRRIDALNFSMAHDDGQLPENVDDADVVLVGISRTSKTPTSIYLANRGIKTANVPLIPGMDVPPALLKSRKALVVGLIASADRIIQVRQHRILGLSAEDQSSDYVDRMAVAEEISNSRKLCARQGWPIIEVTRRSIEETAAAVLGLLAEKRQKDQAG
jgi:regulator of PEP synthase PpsR (kinase-PPPase family)